MRARSLVCVVGGLAAAVALVGAGCGGGESESASAASEATSAAAVEPSQAYRDQLATVVAGPDGARHTFHEAPPGPLTETLAQDLATASRTAARELDELTPPGGLADLNRELAERYRRWATALEGELARKPISTSRLGDAVREYGKAADSVYEQILIAP